MHGVTEENVLIVQKNGTPQLLTIGQLHFDDVRNFYAAGWNDLATAMEDIPIEKTEIVGVDEFVNLYTFENELALEATPDTRVLTEHHGYIPVSMLTEHMQILTADGYAHLSDVSDTGLNVVYSVYSHNLPVVINGVVVQGDQDYV